MTKKVRSRNGGKVACEFPGNRPELRASSFFRHPSFVIRHFLQFSCAVFLTGTLPAQLGLPVETNLFGDDLVRKFDLDGNNLAINEDPEVSGAKPKAKVEGYEHTLIFQDGRQLRGALVELTKSEVVWRRPDASAALRFARAEVRRLVLAATSEGSESESRFNRVNQEMNAQIAFQQLAQGVGELVVETIAQTVFSDPGRIVRLPNSLQITTLKLSETLRQMGAMGVAEAAPGAEKKISVASATLKLPGGDWLFGEVTSADGESFALKLGDGTVLNVPRAPLEWLYLDDHPVPAYGFAGGALDLESWPVRTAGARLEITDGTMTLRDGTMLGRIFHPPQRFEVAFTVPADRETGLRLWIQPFNPQPNCYGTGTFELTFGPKELSRCFYIRDMNRKTSPVPKSDADPQGPVSYRVLYDGLDRHLAVLRNGVEIGDWKFIEDDDKNAKNLAAEEREFTISGLCFDRQNGAAGESLKFSRLQVQPWDGVLPKAVAAGPAGDRLSAGKAPGITGRLESLSADELVFSGEKRKRAAGTFVRLREPGPSLGDADAMLIFGRQGEMNVAGLEIREGRARGRTGFAAALELPVAALQTIAFPSRATGPEQPADALVFQNGNELRGTLLAASAGAGVQWKTAGGQTLDFQPARLAGVRFAERGAAPAGAATAVVELRNGDRLRGEFLGLDEKRLVFRHAQLGAIQLAREGLWSLYPNPKFAVADGGREAGAWISPAAGQPVKKGGPVAESPGSWTVLDGNYIARGRQGGSGEQGPVLTVPLEEIPERFELRVEATDLNGNPPSFGVVLSSKDARTSLQASFNYFNLSLYANSPKARGANNYRNVVLRGKVPDSSSRLALRLFVDRQAGTADIYLNGAPVARVGQNANERLPGFGEVVTVQAGQQEEMTAILSQLWVGPWNGELPRSGEGTPAAVALTNGDAAPGVPERWHEGKFSVATEAGPFELPLEKVQAVEFGGVMTPAPAPARIRLADGGAVSVDAFRWDDRELTAHSATLGDLRLPSAAVRELIFNPAPIRPPRTPPARGLAQKMKAAAEAPAEPKIEQ